MSKRILITGGSGFIGSALIRYIINQTQDSVINVDKLTYAANQSALKEVENNPRYTFEQVDICDLKAIESVFEKYQPDAVMHLAAEVMLIVLLRERLILFKPILLALIRC